MQLLRIMCLTLAACAVGATIGFVTKKPADVYVMDKKTAAYLSQECPMFDKNNPSDADRFCVDYAGRALIAKRNAAS